MNSQDNGKYEEKDIETGPRGENDYQNLRARFALEPATAVSPNLEEVAR